MELEEKISSTLLLEGIQVGIGEGADKLRFLKTRTLIDSHNLQRYYIRYHIKQYELVYLANFVC